MERSSALILGLVAGLGCGHLTDQGTTTDGPGWPPMDEATFRALPVWQGVLELNVVYGFGDFRRGDTTIGARVTARNVGTTHLIGTTSPRHWFYEAYRTPDRTGDPVWSGWTWKGWSIAEPVDIRPGETREFLGGRLMQFPATSLPAGTYHFTASLTLIDTDGGAAVMRTAFFNAGAFEIVR